jgi:hypothetical protein
MRLVPRNIVPQVDFFQSHIAAWAENADALGLGAEVIASMSAAVDAARAAYTNQQIAQNAARSATGNLQLALATMNALGTDIIQLIRV